MGNHKKVSCRKCFRVMRSDNLKTHMKQHVKEMFEKESICSTSITSSIMSLNKETNISLDITSKMYEVTPLEREEIIKRLINNDKEYKYSVARGKSIYEEVNKYGIKEESLCPEYKDLLDVYMKKRNMIDVDNVILRFWQTALLEYMEPSNREVIWNIGANGNKNKSWFQEF